MEQEAWISHRATLARELSDDGWRAVRLAYDALSDILRSSAGEDYVDKQYKSAMDALRPLASSGNRYRWSRTPMKR